MIVCLAILAFVIYFLPTIIASSRNHRNSATIGVLNFFLGWTMLGWIICLAWSFSYQEEVDN